MNKENNNLSCWCCEKDINGNWIHKPCCHNGKCEAPQYADKEDGSIANCIHCGAEMHKEAGNWYHYSQIDEPIKFRGQTHYGP